MEAAKALDRTVLVLNRRWDPIQTTSVKDAIGLVAKGSAFVIDPATFDRHDLVSWGEVSKAMKAVGESLIRSQHLAIVPPEVVVLTASGTEENLLAAIRGGAAGYLLKTESPERIAEFLDGVVHGDAALSGPVARRLLDQVRSGGRGSGVPDRIASVLSARELEVLLLLDEHHGTDEIAQRLFISEHTVRSHVKSLLRKLGVSSRREALEQLALARG